MSHLSGFFKQPTNRGQITGPLSGDHVTVIKTIKHRNLPGPD